MNRREAKREACWLAASMLKGMMQELQFLDDPENLYDDTEREKIDRGFLELITELKRRGCK